MATSDKLPALRPIEVVPVQQADDELYFALRDPAGYTRAELSISPVGCFVLAHLTGEHTVADVQQAFHAQIGALLPEREILRLVSALDDALLLQGARFEAARAERRASYAAAAARDNCARYPAEDELRRALAGLISRGTAAAVGELHGLIAPHLDYERGEPCYADAYATLARCCAARYVILGTNHAGEGRGAVATRKDFVTPLGRVPVDRDFLSRLEDRAGATLCDHEMDHAAEHSVELQVHLLQVLHDRRPFTIVPVLCSEACDAESGAPSAVLRRFADALREVRSKSSGRTVVIAAADLSHVGQRFGDAQPTTPEFLAALESSDRRLLGMLAAGAEDEFVLHLGRTENPTRVCSAGCIYAALRALAGRECRVLRYHQAVDMDTETHVTCAAAAIF